MDPKKMLTEETPETTQDYASRNLTEVGGETQVSKPQRVLTEDLPQEEDEDENPKNLQG